jgi:hypothetical protein
MWSALRRLTLAVLVTATAGCFDFQPDPPPGPSALPAARVATVRIEYRQPNHCENPEPEHCVDLVWFLASWMHPNQDEEIPLELVPGSYTWVGVAKDVPVNWPPVDEPHVVRVFDPHLKGTPTGGVTAARLIVGGQVIYYYDQPGTPAEGGFIYIDDNGTGRNPL